MPHFGEDQMLLREKLRPELNLHSFVVHWV